MIKHWFTVFTLLLAALLQPAQASDLKSIPQGLGFPVLVRVGVSFLDSPDINENEGTFTSTVDVRLRWQDLRLAYPASAQAAGFMDFDGKAAEKKLEEIWQPEAVIANLKGEAIFKKMGLRIFPNGRVELMQRTRGVFTADYPLEKFPFDTQSLGIHVVSRSAPIQKVALDYRQDDLEFSSTRHIKEIDGWELGLVELAKAPVPAWRGEVNPGVVVAQQVRRNQSSLLATIFVPLFASLLIPLLVIWLNRMEDGEFAVDAFELTNISIGGLFAVVALNFTVNSSFVKLAVGDNPVMRLFGLNYFMLALSIGVGIALYRYSVVRRLFGPYVQEEFFRFISWGIPVLCFGAASAMVGMALF
jgi:hypothetical protein